MLKEEETWLGPNVLAGAADCELESSGMLDDSEEWQPSTSGNEDDMAGNEDDMGGASSLDSQEDQLFERRYCTNCTGRLHGSECGSCGHRPAEDKELFATVTSTSGRCGLPSNQQILLLWDDRMLLHEQQVQGTPHPERPDRVRAVIARLMASGLSSRCVSVPCREASIEELAKVHSPQLVHYLQTMFVGKEEGEPRHATHLVTPDTYANQHTFLCARLAAGGAAEVASRVARGEAAHGATVVRPPGHHAESGMAMGFCFFNNAAVAAKAAQASGAQRVLILDWDIHHGNGTQHIFEHDASVMYMSLHRYDRGDFYPGTGGVLETGLGAGEGYSVNVPWDSSEIGNGDYIAAFNQVLVPIAYEFNPDLIIVSAGFDAAEGDPIGGCRVTPECYAHLTAMLKAVAPLVLVLEGGYNLDSTASSTEACLRVLLGEQPPVLPGPRYPSLWGARAIQSCAKAQARYWKCLRAMAPFSEVGVSTTGLTLQLPPVVETKAEASAKQPPTPNRRLSRHGHLYGTAHGRKQQILLAIHRRALRAVWKRHVLA